MASPRSTTVLRVEHYCGPAVEVRSDTLDTYEAAGGWVITPKIDGMWCMLTVGDGQHLMKSRDARTGYVSGANAEGLSTLPIPEALRGSILVGELEAASQWATKNVLARGYRQLYLFDVAQIRDKDVRKESWTDRQGYLKEVMKILDSVPEVSTRMVEVPAFSDRFSERYKEWIDADFEGCVLKQANSSAIPTRSDGKTDSWVRCKKQVVDDFVFAGIGMTPGGVYSAPRPTGQWGLFDECGKLVIVMKASMPTALMKPEYVGNLVCEFKGWAKLDSGALRHGQFLRVRKDKQPGECLLVRP